MDKFIIKAAPKKDGYKLINVRQGTYEAIQQMKEDTGSSMSDIVDAMVKFCMERLVVEE